MIKPMRAAELAYNVEYVQPIEIRILTATDAAAYWHFRLAALETEPDAFGASPYEHRTTSVAGCGGAP
jgi:hypothetical protein